jgi:hypothetical protein
MTVVKKNRQPVTDHRIKRYRCESARSRDPHRFYDFRCLACRSASGPLADSQRRFARPVGAFARPTMVASVSRTLPRIVLTAAATGA